MVKCMSPECNNEIGRMEMFCAECTKELNKEAEQMKHVDLIKALNDLRDLHKIQGQPGNWDSDHYMTGLYNGMEMALAIFEGRDPEYRNCIVTVEKR